MPNSSNVLRGLALAALIASLAGCSEYMQRRDAISLNAGDAVMTNRVTQMVDPWPRASADNNIAFNGERMEAAVQALSHRTRNPAGRHRHRLGLSAGASRRDARTGQHDAGRTDRDAIRTGEIGGIKRQNEYRPLL